VLLAEKHIIDQGWHTADEVAAWRHETEAEVNDTAYRVRREPSPDPSEDDWAALSRPEYREQYAAS
jgi:TPP-dependent pyruvate/acetoin dehydrogenase alpha subunit